MKGQTHKLQTIYRINLKKAKYYIEHGKSRFHYGYSIVELFDQLSNNR